MNFMAGKEKTSRKLLLLGISLIFASVAWLVGSILLTPQVSADNHALFSIIPFLLLFLAGAALVGLGLSAWGDRAMGLPRWDDED
jgi:hypothetical protein